MIIWIAIGGFLGAVARYSVNRWMFQKVTSIYPYGTFLVNILGSFGLGIIIGMEIKGQMAALIGVGFFGAFTTFSTFKMENIKLFVQKQKKAMILYLLTSYGLGILFAFLGIFIGSSIHHHVF